MKNTLISTTNSEILENLILKYGQIVTSQQIFAEENALFNHKQAQYFIATLVAHGWLMRIKKGLYAISDLSTRGFLALSSFAVAHLLVNDSYISFESALQHHGMFDQLTKTTTSVSLKAHKRVLLQQIEYRFVKTKEEYYFGWQEVDIDHRATRIATAEKAIVDMVNFHKSVYAIDVVMEKLREYKKDLDIARLNEYIGKFSMTTIKIFGFLFDLLSMDSSQLLRRAQHTRGAHRMSASARAFNAKWRLYYDEHFDQYKRVSSV